MKIRTDIVKMYKDIHGWVGIISGLCLFVAFYAGAITMFEHSLQRWATPPSTLPAPVSLERTPELIDKVLAQHPEAAKGYKIRLETGPEQPARMSWTSGRGDHDHHGPRTNHYAALDSNGELVLSETEASPVARFVNQLHRQVGIMIPRGPGMMIMGVVSLLYAVALVSGVIILLPSLVKDLFATRLGKNAKRMWLDLHNVLGFFSLPFHIVMAITAVVFAFHDQFYDSQSATFAASAARPERPAASAPPPSPRDRPDMLAPAAIVAALKTQAPGLKPAELRYGQAPDGTPTLQVRGEDPHHGNRGSTYTLAMLDPVSGKVTGADYLGGKQDGWGATITGFFTLHFGSFGGIGIRWAYFLLGLGGAFLFYTGNLLWVESRRKRERRNSGPVSQSRSTRILGALTVGVPLGCIAGISITIAAAKPLGLAATPGLHSLIYHVVFFAFTGWALLRGSARGAVELLPGAALAMLTVPLASMVYAMQLGSPVVTVDVLSLLGSGLLVLAWRGALVRVRAGARDSVWSAPAGERGTGPALQEPAE